MLKEIARFFFFFNKTEKTWLSCLIDNPITDYFHWLLDDLHRKSTVSQIFSGHKVINLRANFQFGNTFSSLSQKALYIKQLKFFHVAECFKLAHNNCTRFDKKCHLQRNSTNIKKF